MGKKTRKTRWRTLSIADEQSDSEDSNPVTTNQRSIKQYQQTSLNRFPYSSQSTPRRRYQYDGTKSTRSSSTASENKISFNEDEYTRITTPRQDVLFKKGYLNKPKNYQTQTSTGTSTTSTGNSTGNGTPDYQSTDLEYESQFVFPNGFLDQNGIYYVNSYEGYPLMLFNPPTYYHEFSNYKSKRYSTGSLTESMSPNNEEATSQDLSGGETNNVSDYSSGHHQSCPMAYQNGNGVNHTNDVMNGQGPLRIKKRRRRKVSKTCTAHNSTECSEDETDSCSEEVLTQVETPLQENTCDTSEEKTAKTIEPQIVHHQNGAEESTPQQTESAEESNPPKFHLKPDAEEFVPRAYRPTEIPVQFIKVPANFVPIPLVPFNGHSAFIPQGIPISFPPPPPNFVGFVPQVPPKQEETPDETDKPTTNDLLTQVDDCDKTNTANDENVESSSNKTIDIATVVSKLEEAVKEQEQEEQKSNTNGSDVAGSPKRKTFRQNQRYKSNTTYRRNYCNSMQNSPHRHIHQQNGHLEETSSNFSQKPVDAVSTIPPAQTTENSSNVTPNQSEVARRNSIPQQEQTSVIQQNGEASNNRQLQTRLNHRNSPQRQSNLHEGESCPRHPQRQSPLRNGDANAATESHQSHQRKTYQKNGYANTQGQPHREVRSTSLQKQQFLQNGYYSPQRQQYHRNDETIQIPQHSHLRQADHVQKNKETVPQKQEVYRNPEVEAVSDSRPNETINGIRNSPEKFKKSWRPYQNGVTTKWQSNKNSKQEYSKGSGKNYSETVKQISHKPNEDKPQQKSAASVTNSPSKTSTGPNTPTHQTNQWIPVSGRKKRKIKAVEEFEDQSIEVEVEESQNDLFESYDITQLVDVIPPSKEEVISVEVSNEKVEEIINALAQNQPTVLETPDLTEVKSVTEIETEIITYLETPDEVSVETSVEEAIVAIDEIEKESVASRQKQKKKGTQKPLTKRVIITDVDMSDKFEEIKTPVKKIVKKIEKPVKKIDIPDIKPDIEPEPEKEKEVVTEATVEDEDKKKAKKKKKKYSQGSKTTTTTQAESYDFLLDSALVVVSEDKTNDEISQELDRIIQKGMYSSLEEKVKSLNIADDCEDFFKSVFSTITSEKNGGSDILQKPAKTSTVGPTGSTQRFRMDFM
ncbi:unnamed protein product [Acanthoscelides obtectus]|uniref:Uncharacterized protein n=2 Tax=Acanthoscelides obtectus TaxID=200917 RepID=A0A9P0PK67_ACAOB|nr:unnamed protein product [Acanthoscelides obtectus]CAK1663123.1 hypothetical protein AOBTE_LOCUS23492 [Acanthoscelides obtectus]